MLEVRRKTPRGRRLLRGSPGGLMIIATLTVYIARDLGRRDVPSGAKKEACAGDGATAAPASASVVSLAGRAAKGGGTGRRGRSSRGRGSLLQASGNAAAQRWTALSDRTPQREQRVPRGVQGAQPDQGRDSKATVPGEGEEELSQARHEVSGGGQATQAMRIMQFILTFGADMATRTFRSRTAPSGCLRAGVAPRRTAGLHRGAVAVAGRCSS
jgi:hypothetical protein